jgi:hypothetical protein
VYAVREHETCQPARFKLKGLNFVEQFKRKTNCQVCHSLAVKIRFANRGLALEETLPDQQLGVINGSSGCAADRIM